MRISTAFATVFALTLSACATITEEQQYTMDNNRVLAMERFHLAEARCQKMGGVMEITAKRWGPRSPRDYAAAKCVKY